MKKIAIVGGGMGAITTAFAVTSEPGWEQQYDVTLYQLGHRIGGKGASGRNAAHHQRIEEHGLHVWLGFYDNAFKAMRSCYEELGRKPGTPLASIDDAFKKHSVVVIMEHVGDRYLPWQLEFPENQYVPGKDRGVLLPTLWGYLEKVAEWMFDHFEKSRLSARARPSSASPLGQKSWLASAFDDLGSDLSEILGDAEKLGLGIGGAALHSANALIDLLDDDVEKHSAAHHQALAGVFEEFLHWLQSEVDQELSADTDLRRAYILLELAAVMALGMLRDGVLFRGFDAIERWDYSEWLARNGASPLVVTSAPVRALYDLVFGFEPRNIAQPNFAAGTALRSIFSMVFDYKGAIFWEMQAGMGDTVFGPFYEVLKKRGVKFEFFHKVENLGVSADGGSIESLRVARQVTLAPGRDSYDPLVPVKELPCWPSVPRYEQLDPDQVAELERRSIDLESYYSDWQPSEVRTLRRGEDFDLVVLGVPPGAHPYICRELIEKNARFAQMVTNVKTVQTQALQLWFKPDLAGLGWRGPPPVLDAYVDPLNTWADLSHLIPREDWPADFGVHNVAYLCGPFQDPPSGPPAPGSNDGLHYPERERQAQFEASLSFARQSARGLWPSAVGADGALDYAQLAAAAEREGLQRFEDQYFRINVEPSERYVLSVKGSRPFRLAAGDSGFANLVLAGDWTLNGFLDAGCIEATVISGLQAASAILGRQLAIRGVNAPV